MATLSEDLIWEIRAFVYQHFAATAHPPSVAVTAARFTLADGEAAAAYEQLHELHAIFLEAGTHNILMANPFSAIQTQFKVNANGRPYFANCAWDSLGVPAVLHVDAHIEAACSQTADPIHLHVKDGRVANSEALVHLLVPFKQWYNDMVFT